MGLAQLLRTLLIHLTGWTPKIDIAGLLNYAINLPVLLIAWRRLDHTVVLKTLLAVTGITVFLMIIPRTDILSGDQLARCLIGGILCGGSIGIILWMGGTSGGMDVIGMMLIKSGSHTSIGHVNLAWNLMLYTVCVQEAARQMQFQILRIVNGGKQEVRQRMFLLGWGIAHRRSEIALRVIVDEKYMLVFVCQSRGKIQSSHRLTDATFLIGDCKNCTHNKLQK